MKEYFVKFRSENKIKTYKFERLLKAREFALHQYRKSGFISLTNKKGIPLCL